MNESEKGLTRAPRIPRKCLRCSKKFSALGKFNRVCPKCEGLNLRVARIEQNSTLARFNDTGEPMHSGRVMKKRVRAI